MRNTRRSFLSLALALGLGFAAAPARAGEADGVSAASDAARPFVVKVHADWCGTCMKLVDTWEQLGSGLGDGARLVLLDVTDRERLAESEAEAKRLGLSAFFDEYKARTGTIAVLRGDSRQEVAVLKGVTDLARYESAVAEARGADPS